jgi:hypothetical protein
MTAHGRDDEGISTKALDVVDNDFDDLADVRDATASDSDCHGMAGLNLVTERQARELCLNFARYIVDLRRFKPLSNPKNKWILGHAFNQATFSKSGNPSLQKTLSTIDRRSPFSEE